MKVIGENKNPQNVIFFDSRKLIPEKIYTFKVCKMIISPGNFLTAFQKFLFFSHKWGRWGKNAPKWAKNCFLALYVRNYTWYNWDFWCFIMRGQKWHICLFPKNPSLGQVDNLVENFETQNASAYLVPTFFTWVSKGCFVKEMKLCVKLCVTRNCNLKFQR